MGGRTILEAKESMTVAEAFEWMEYYKLRGTFSINRKLEWSFAMIAMLINRAAGGKKEMEDFMPYEKTPEIENDIEEAMRILVGAANVK